MFLLVLCSWLFGVRGWLKVMMWLLVFSSKVVLFCRWMLSFCSRC